MAAAAAHVNHQSHGRANAHPQSSPASPPECIIMVWFIVNPVSGGGRGEVMLGDLQRAFGPAQQRKSRQGATPTTYHVRRYTASAFLHTSVATQMAQAAPSARSDRHVSVFLLSTERAGEGLRVAEHIARAVATQKLDASVDDKSFVHVLVPIGGDGTLSEVVNGVCRGVIAVHHGYKAHRDPSSSFVSSSSSSSRNYYFRVLEEKSALRYLAPAFLYMPTGTGADFAKLKLCCRTVDDCVACLESFVDTLMATTAASPEDASPPSLHAASPSPSRALACYEVDVGRLTFPCTGRVHFFMNECSFGMSCDVIERAESLRRTRWMAPLGGTVLFATASVLSLLCWSPKEVRVMRLPPMPALPSCQDSSFGEVVGQSRVRASTTPPVHIADAGHARRALSLDDACCTGLRLQPDENKMHHAQTRESNGGTDTLSTLSATAAASRAHAILAHCVSFQQDQDALNTLDYYSAKPATKRAVEAESSVFRERESASTSRNHSFTTVPTTGTTEAQMAETGLPIVGSANPLFFAESGAPQPDHVPASFTATTTADTRVKQPYVLASRAQTTVLRDAKAVQRALDLPEPFFTRHAGDGTRDGASPDPLRWVQLASSTISFGIGRWFGGGLHITPHADPADGLLSATSWQAQLIPFVGRALSLYNGRHVRWSTTAAFDGQRFLLDSAASSSATTTRTTKNTDKKLDEGVAGNVVLGPHGDHAGESAAVVSPSPVLWVEADGELVEPLPAVIEIAGMLTFLLLLPTEADGLRVAQDAAASVQMPATANGADALCQPVRFGPAAPETTRAADWAVCHDAMLSHGDAPGVTWDAITRDSQDASGDGPSHPPAAVMPEYVRLYLTESTRWPPPDDDGFFSIMANSAPKWRLCCGTLHRVWQVMHHVTVRVQSRCGHWGRQVHTWWCRGGRRERQDDDDGRIVTRSREYPKLSLRHDLPV